MSNLDPRYQGLAEGLNPVGSGKSRSLGYFVLHLIFTLPLLSFGLFGNPFLVLGSLSLVLTGVAYLSAESSWARVPAVVGLLLSGACVWVLVGVAGDRHGADIFLGALSLPVFLATGLAWIHVLRHRGMGKGR